MSDLMNNSSVHLLIANSNSRELFFLSGRGRTEAYEESEFPSASVSNLYVCVCVYTIFLHLIIQVDRVTFLPDREVGNVREFSLPAWTVWLRDHFKQFC